MLYSECIGMIFLTSRKVNLIEFFVDVYLQINRIQTAIRGNKITDAEILAFSVHEISTYKSSSGQHQKKSSKTEVKARTSYGNVCTLVQLKQLLNLGLVI